MKIESKKLKKKKNKEMLNKTRDINKHNAVSYTHLDVYKRQQQRECMYVEKVRVM